MRNLISIWFAKLLGWVLRGLGYHGAALPGLIIEKVHPNFLNSMLTQLPNGVAVISGTNGKTTTTKMVTSLLRDQGKKVITNRTGGNFVRGIFATVAQSADLRGSLNYDIAVIELDEAYAVRFVRLHRPSATLVLNVTRDQLDRFGEIDTTAKLLQKVILATTKVAVLNDDDNRVALMHPSSSAKAVYFGAAKALDSRFPNDEQLYGLKTEKKAHDRLVELEDVDENKAIYVYRGANYEVDLQIDGEHNALNGAAATSLVAALFPGIIAKDLFASLAKVRPAFGRGEEIDYRGRKYILQLVKNPASFRQALQMVDIHHPDAVAVIINDDYADGRDVSWLWDIDFEKLKTIPKPILTAGTRAYDMANRLKYQGAKYQKPTLSMNDMVRDLEDATKEGETAIIYATYTAMLAVRRLISRKTELETV